MIEYDAIANQCIFLQYQEMSVHEPLLTVTGELKTILSGVCEMMEIYELALTKVLKESDFHAVFGQALLESCDWVSLFLYV